MYDLNGATVHLDTNAHTEGYSYDPVGRMLSDSNNIDHSIPKALDGNASIDNAQTTCPWCTALTGGLGNTTAKFFIGMGAAATSGTISQRDGGNIPSGGQTQCQSIVGGVSASLPLGQFTGPAFSYATTVAANIVCAGR